MFWPEPGIAKKNQSFILLVDEKKEKGKGMYIKRNQYIDSIE